MEWLTSRATNPNYKGITMNKSTITRLENSFSEQEIFNIHDFRNLGGYLKASFKIMYPVPNENYSTTAEILVRSRESYSAAISRYFELQQVA